MGVFKCEKYLRRDETCIEHSRSITWKVRYPEMFWYEFKKPKFGKLIKEFDLEHLVKISFELSSPMCTGLISENRKASENGQTFKNKQNYFTKP